MTGGSAPPPVPADRPILRLRQVHGSAVVVVGADAPAGSTAAPAAGSPPAAADALVGVGPGASLVVLTADCAPVALGSPEGVHAAVHVGWRGLGAGVIDGAAAVMRALGATELVAGLGPTIHPCCYEFGPAELDAVAAVAGDGVRATTTDGRPALDLPAAVRACLAAADVTLVVEADECTACGERSFSHRRFGDEGRQALFVWRQADPAAASTASA